MNVRNRCMLELQFNLFTDEKRWPQHFKIYILMNFYIHFNHKNKNTIINSSMSQTKHTQSVNSES